MEDLKQIQEFFSKPLEEGEQLDIIDLAKVVKAVHQTGHPVTVLLTPKFNEIEVLTGMNAPDDMLRDLSNAVDSLGYGRNEIIIAGDSSNLSRREYSDIRRVNGGHKDYFEESLNEDKEKAINYFQQAIKLSHTNKVRNLILKAVRELGLEVPKVWTESLNENEDPIIVKYFKRGDNHFQILVKYERPTGFTTALGSRTALGSQIDQNEAAAQEKVKTIVNKLKADFDLDNVEVNKGQVAGRYYIDAFSDSFREMDVNDLERSYALNEAEFTDYSNKELAAYCKNNPTDKKAAKELHKRSQALKGLTRTDEAKKLTYNDFVRMVRDDMMAGSAPDERPSEELVGKRAKAYYNDYLQGASVDDLFEAKKDVKGDITDLLTGRYGWKFQLATGVGALIANLARHPEMIEKLLSMIGLNEIDEAKVEVDDKTEFKLDLKHLLDKHVVEQGYSLTSEATKEEENEFHKDLDKLVHKTFGHSSDEKKKMAEYIAETIKLGMSLNEELCDKGKRYIKARQAAGEKSSAYLSGRAVRVCKGQIEWPKKGKKKK